MNCFRGIDKTSCTDSWHLHIRTEHLIYTCQSESSFAPLQDLQNQWPSSAVSSGKCRIWEYSMQCSCLQLVFRRLSIFLHSPALWGGVWAAEAEHKFSLKLIRWYALNPKPRPDKNVLSEHVLTCSMLEQCEVRWGVNETGDNSLSSCSGGNASLRLSCSQVKANWENVCGKFTSKWSPEVLKLLEFAQEMKLVPVQTQTSRCQRCMQKHWNRCFFSQITRKIPGLFTHQTSCTAQTSGPRTDVWVSGLACDVSMCRVLSTGRMEGCHELQKVAHQHVPHCQEPRRV